MKSIRLRAMTLAVMAMFCAVATLRAGDGEAIRKVVEEKTPALVTVKFMLKVNFPGSDGQESEVETLGVVISEDGLILCGNAMLGGIVGIMNNMTGGGGGQDISMVPSDFKVLIGDDTEGIEAKLLARDSDLDIAWVKIKELGEKKLAFVDMEKASTPQVGDSLLVLERKSKLFDRVVSFIEMRASSTTKKPRNLILLEGQGPSGSPVFTFDGAFAGFTIIQVPEAGEADTSIMSRFTASDAMFPAILPAAELAKATKNATAAP